MNNTDAQIKNILETIQEIKEQTPDTETKEQYSILENNYKSMLSKEIIKDDIKNRIQEYKENQYNNKKLTSFNIYNNPKKFIDTIKQETKQKHNVNISNEILFNIAVIFLFDIYKNQCNYNIHELLCLFDGCLYDLVYKKKSKY